MSISALLQFPTSFVQLEQTAFSNEMSSKLIDIYNSMYNDNFTRSEKINNIKKILNICNEMYVQDKKRLICLVVFSMLNTAFGRSIIQENEKFREIVFDKYEDFINDSNQDFVEALKIRKI
jgi:hypothetical protein